MAASNKKVPKKVSTLSERFKWQQTEIREKRGVSQQQVVKNRSSATSTQQQQKRVSQPRATSTVQVLNYIIIVTGTIYKRLKLKPMKTAWF